MRSVSIFILLISSFFTVMAWSQNYSFDFNSTGRRVCLTSAEVNASFSTVKIIFHDSLANNSEPIYVNRRLLGTNSWTNVATALPAGTGHWLDVNVSPGQVWEYQVRRQNTWNFQAQNYDAIGYTIGALLPDNSVYKGQMILLVADDIPANLSTKYERLKKELTADGWLVNELIVAKANGWDSGSDVVTVKNLVTGIYSNAPVNDKPKVLFILGHVPMPRSGSSLVTAPDAHDQNKGARGCDAFYADIDGVFTDTATYNPGGLSSPLAINLPGDFKWDQDFFPSEIEMAFGRVDFEYITEISASEMEMMESYLDRLSAYKNVETGSKMGEKSGFNFGYNNSNDGSYRSLFNISNPDSVFQNFSGTNHNQWVQSNGPFKIYMQNVQTPSIADWQNFGMDATVFSSDQSYWGFNDVPQPNGVYSRIRALLGLETKCLVTLWTTMGINIFHQACTGEALGLSMKTIMNHNSSNQYLEKAPQQYDTEEWWNRTHFSFLGDPTLNLYQVAPPSNLSISNANGQALLSWNASPDLDVIGYHIYQSSSASGKFNRISNSLVTSTNFILPTYQFGAWYMVKAIKKISSGCGQFLQPSLGIQVLGDVPLSTEEVEKTLQINYFPNPIDLELNIVSSTGIQKVEIYSSVGQLFLRQEGNSKTNLKLDMSAYQSGAYWIQVYSVGDDRRVLNVIKK